MVLGKIAYDMATTPPESSGGEEFARVDVWRPDSLDAHLEIGMSGVCNHCDTEMIKSTSGVSRLQCPDCGYLAGMVIRFPTLQEGGEPGENVEWPDKKEGWEIDDGRATFDVGYRGEHIDCGTFAENTRESKFGVPKMCCDECGDQFGRASQINTLVDPPNNIDKL